MIILGIDPGTARMGYGVLRYKADSFEVIDYGCLETSSKEVLAERLLQLNNGLEELLKKYQPDFVGVEELFFNRNVTNALAVGHARGVVLLAAAKARKEIREYTPLQVKQALVGHGRADKKQVQYMVKTLLKLPRVPQPDDTADALAVAICTAYSWRLEGTR